MSQPEKRMKTFFFDYEKKGCDMPNERIIKKFFGQFGVVDNIKFYDEEEKGKVYFSEIYPITIVPTSIRLAGMMKDNMTKDNFFSVRPILKKNNNNKRKNFRPNGNFKRVPFQTGGKKIIRGKMDTDDSPESTDNAFLRNNKQEHDHSRDNQSRDNQSRDNQSRDNQSRDNQSRDNQSRDNQSRDNQSRDLDLDDKLLLGKSRNMIYQELSSVTNKLQSTQIDEQW